MIKPYTEYKSVDSRWFNELPTHWQSMKAKWVFSNEKQRSDDSDEQLAASQKYGVVPQKLMIELNNANVMLALKGTENFKKVRENDFVISLRSFEGGIEYSAYYGCISPAYTVLRLRDSNSEALYFKYALKCSPFITALNSTSEGIRDGKTITYDEFGELIIALPPIEEQKIISNYLDQETTRIDALITEKQHFIDLLKEKRQALISHYVTKGLDPTVPMKDSGVEWIGEIPEHWTVPKLAHVTDRIGDGLHGTPEYRLGTELFFINGNNLLDGKIRFSETTKEVSEESYVEHKINLTSSSVLLSINGTIGNVAIYRGENIVLGKSAAYINVDDSIMPDFLRYSLQSKYAKTFYDLEVTGTTIYNLSLQSLRRFRLALPPLAEQKQITKEIDSKIASLDALISESRNSINLLKEHRTALISAAVTGKIDVRGFCDPAPEAA